MFARVKKAYDEKEGKKEVQDKDENTMSTTNDNNRPAFAGLLGTIGGVTAGPQGYNTEPSTVVENNTELSAMLAEPINKEESSEKINQDMNLVDPPKQLVKTSQENNSKDSAQVGSISLFSVVLSILIVTSIILLAMILNILLK